MDCAWEEIEGAGEEKLPADIDQRFFVAGGAEYFKSTLTQED